MVETSKRTTQQISESLGAIQKQQVDKNAAIKAERDRKREALANKKSAMSPIGLPKIKVRTGAPDFQRQPSTARTTQTSEEIVKEHNIRQDVRKSVFSFYFLVNQQPFCF